MWRRGVTGAAHNLVGELVRRRRNPGRNKPHSTGELYAPVSPQDLRRDPPNTSPEKPLVGKKQIEQERGV